MARVAINGMGRIGRALFKILIENGEMEVVAVNDLIPADNIAYLLKYDSVYGFFSRPVEDSKEALIIDEKTYPFFSEKDPGKLPWKDLQVDVVFECAGVFNTRPDLEKHIRAGAGHVILSSRAKDEDIETVVHGVNTPKAGADIISCASCTTNCIAPLVEIMGRRIGMTKAVMTTVHAYTSTQDIVDKANKQWKRGRAGAVNFIPTTTGAAKATTLVLPEFTGKFDGIAVRGPVPVGSLSDVVFLVQKKTSVEEVNDVFREESQTPRYQGVLRVSEDPLVSSDIIRDPSASVVDASMTQVVDGNLVKVLAWYDNEWGYAHQMVREANRLLRQE
ncbi:MAG: type I glyceraldehyde-3-phosphate dehydrogenase [Desulfomonilia bacterium]